MQVKMLTDLGNGAGFRWPRAGEVGDVPDEHGAHAVANGYAVKLAAPVAPVAEKTTAKPAAETATKPKPRQRRAK